MVQHATTPSSTVHYTRPGLPQFHQHHRKRERAVEESCRFLNGSKEDTSLSSPSQDSYAHVSCQTCPEALYNSNTTFSHAQKSSVKTETGTKRKTTIEEVGLQTIPVKVWLYGTVNTGRYPYRFRFWKPRVQLYLIRVGFNLLYSSIFWLVSQASPQNGSFHSY